VVRAAGAQAAPELEYRTCATSSKADAKAAAERMIGRRDTYMSARPDFRLVIPGRANRRRKVPTRWDHPGMAKH